MGTKTINVPGQGTLNFPDTMSDDDIKAAIQKLVGAPSAAQAPAGIDPKPGVQIEDEIADWKKYGRRGLEFPDAPTTAHLPLPGLRVWNGKDTAGNPGLSIGAKAATLFGPTLTDNPDARQEIYVKHLPGAKAISDRYGNPMVEYQGKRYYTARPGEFDAMDAGRIATTTAAAFPLLAAAPAGLPAAMAIGGLGNAGLSLAEDAATRAAGGTSQQIDPAKAAIAGTIGAVLPPFIQKAVLPAAGAINAAVRGGTPLGDDAIRAMGLNPDILTPQQRQIVSQTARRTFGDQQAVQSAYRQSLGREFGTDMTRGEISQNAGQMGREKLWSGPGDPVTERTMQDFRTGPRMEGVQAGQGGQEGQRTAAQNILRGQMGSGTPMTQQEAAAALKRGYEAADTQAARHVTSLYDASTDPAELARMGVPGEVPMGYVNQLGDVVRGALTRSGPGRTIVNDDFPHLAPNAARALAQIERWQQPGGLGPPGTAAINWEGVDNMRRTLLQYRDAAYSSGGTRTDQAAINRIIDGFDSHFGQINPLLNDARAAHGARMSTFQPGQDGQDKATSAALTALQGQEEGASVVRSIFGQAKSGDALQMIDHLQNNVFPSNPQMQGVLKEQALRRLTVDERTGDTLSPRRTVTAIQKALDGDAERPLYQRLFDADEIARLRRYLDLQRAIADGRESPNPSKSGLFLAGILKPGAGAATGAAIGHAIGSPFGLEQGGMVLGGGVGAAVGKIVPRIQAGSAIAPPANYTPIGQTSPAALRGGLLMTPSMRDEAMGQYRGTAVDRFMRSLLGQ